MASHTEGHYDIDGKRPAFFEQPTSADAVVRILATAEADGQAAAPIGGGGALQIGNPIERYDLALDMRGLNRILEHQAADLVLSVESGARLSDIADALAIHGQWLPIEAPIPSRATIGGLVATALSGPGRLGHGSLRDYLIGISVVSPAGGLAKAGGMVVKNVSGFDLMRLHHGAVGTLGVIVSANFKVLPAPRGQATLIATFETTSSALAVAQAIGDKVSRPSAVQISRPRDAGATLAIRFDGLLGQVDIEAKRASDAVGVESRMLVDDESRAWWRMSVDALAQPTDGTIELRLGCRPAAVSDLVAMFDAYESKHDISLKAQTIWPGLGSVIIRLDVPATLSDVDAMLDLVESLGATWRIAAAPLAVKAGRDVWGRPPASLDTMRRLKDQFDPSRTLNPGRFSGHI